MAVGSGKPGVVGKERCAESLGERDVRGIVRGESVSILPDAWQQIRVRMPRKREYLQERNSLIRAKRRKTTTSCQPPQ